MRRGWLLLLLVSAVVYALHHANAASDGVLGYPLDEGTGGVATDVSSGRSGTLVNGGSWTVGRFGGALALDGTSQYVRVDAPGLPTGDFTWALWVHRRSTQRFQTLMEAQGTTSAELELNLASGAVMVWSSGAQRLVTNAVVPLQTWTHVALTRAGSTLRVYINGTADARTGSDARPFNFSTCPLLLGVDADAGCTGLLNGYLDGALDDVRVYDRALTAAEIQAVMAGPLGPGGADVTPPVRSTSQAVVTLPAGTTSTTLALQTNEAAACRSAGTPGVAYAQMPLPLASTTGLTHTLAVTGLTNGSTRAHYVRCQDQAGNANPDDLLLSVVVATGTGTLPGLSLYVSPGGNDANPGTIDQPFRTLARARDAVRTLTASMAGHLQVVLRGGEYSLAEPLVFSTLDSGMHGFDVIYTAYPGERPILHGGQRLTQWTAVGGGIYKAPVGTLRFRQLYVNGVRAIRARTPDAGDYYQVRAWDVAGRRVQVANDEVAAWGRLNQVEMVILGRGVNQSNLRLASVAQTATGAWITPREPERTRLFQQVYPPKDAFRPFYFENALEFLDTPGEWYLNPDTNEVFYLPRAGENLATAEVVAPRLETLVTVQGTLAAPVHNLRFRGLTFAYSTWLRPSAEGYVGDQASLVFTQPLPDDEITSYPGHRLPAAVHVEAATAVHFERNVFEHLGGSALNLYRAVTDATVVGNRLTDVSGSGISLDLGLEGNPSDTRVISRRNVLANNYIAQTGRDYYQTVGIMLGYAQDTQVEHNELADMPYSGISAGWGWDDVANVARNSVIRYNDIRNVLTLMADGGGIYTLSRQPGTLIAENYVHAITRTGVQGGFNISGIYLDEGSNFITVRDNVLQNTGDRRIFQNANGGSNTFANNDGASPAVIANAGLQAAYADIRPGAAPPPADTTPPTRANGQPAAPLPAGTQTATLSLVTDEPATCQHGRLPGVAYANLPFTFSTTGGTSHEESLTPLADGQAVAIYVRCQDGAGNANPDDFVITVAVTAPGADTTPPQVALVQPLPGATLADTVLLRADASDAGAVASVEFYLGPLHVGTDDSAPFAVALDTTSLANGPYALSAQALDLAGNRGVSAPVAITVANHAATPVLSPSGGTFTGAVTVVMTTATPGAEVRYTTDGTAPGPTAPLYTGPLTLTGNALLRAIAYQAGLAPSPMAAATFVVTPAAGDPSAVGIYRFSEGSGTTSADASPNANVASLRNGVVWTAGRFGAGLAFDGTNDHLRVASPDLPTGDFTWQAWIKATSWRAFQAVLMARDGVGPELDLDGAGRVLVYSSSRRQLTSAGQVPLGTWTHIALTRTNGTLRVYINGVQDPSTGFDRTVYDFGTCPLFIGVDTDSGCTSSPKGFFHGAIDEVRIYNRALSPAEIQQSMMTP